MKVKRRQGEVSVNNAGERKVPQASQNMLVLVLVVESDPALRLWGFGEAACEREQAEPSRCFDVPSPACFLSSRPTCKLARSTLKLPSGTDLTTTHTI
jgi:hypothetical protein